MIGRNRGRLTLIDVVFAGVSVAVLAFLMQPMYDIMNQNAGELGTGEAYLFQMIPAALVMTLLVLVFATAVGGGEPR